MARKKKLDEQEEKQLLIYKAQYDMHMNTLEEVKLRGKKDVVEKMQMIIQDDILCMSKIDQDFANKCIEEAKKKEKKADMGEIFIQSENDDDIISRIKALDEEKPLNERVQEMPYDDFSADPQNMISEEASEPNLYEMASQIEDSFEQKVDVAQKEERQEELIYNNVDPEAQYDLIKLPSKGECYVDKIERVPVGYLTASDENLITSPNLYESGNITSILLKRKILNNKINVDNLVAGDVDAIMVFLRGTSYGNMFPIIAEDPVTHTKIDAEVDLQELKYKPFTLKGDKNGHFDFTTPLQKTKLKFKFLTKGEERLLKRLNANENNDIASFELKGAVEKIEKALKNDNTLSDAEKNGIIDAKKKIEAWSEKKNTKNPNAHTMTVTNTLEMEIVSVNGNTDRKFIHNYVMNMPAADSLAFRRYIYDNQPGVDFRVTVNRPESMGGGSFKCFLEWRDSFFWNISDVSENS